MEEVQRRNVPALGVTVAVLAIFIGVSTLMAPAIYAALGVSVPLDTTACYMIQGAASLLLGFLGTRKRPTAFFFIALLYLPAELHIPDPRVLLQLHRPGVDRLRPGPGAGLRHQRQPTRPVHHRRLGLDALSPERTRPAGRRRTARLSHQKRRTPSLNTPCSSTCRL